MPNAIWQFTDFAGKFLTDGYLYTYEDEARTTPKAVFHDREGQVPWDNPAQLSSVGSIYTLFFADDKDYYVVIEDLNHNQLYAFTIYSTDEQDGNTTSVNRNYIDDGQFRFPLSLSVPNIQQNTWIAPKWLFYKTSPSTSNDNLSILQFPQGQTFVPEGNPVNYLNIDCTVPSPGDTAKYIEYYITDVNSFENNTVTIPLYARSATGSTVTLSWVQNFGTGGTPSAEVVTPIPESTFVLTSSWQKKFASFVVPSTTGKTKGTDENDTARLRINLPLNAVFNYQSTNHEIKLGAFEGTYDYRTYELARSFAFGQKLPVPVYPTDINKVLAVGTELTGTLQEPAYKLISRAGVIEEWAGVVSLPDDGLLCDGTTLDSTASNRKYLNLWSATLNQYGVGTDGFFGIASTDNLNSVITNNYAGAVSAAADVNSTLTITTPTTGTTGYFETVFENSYPITLDSGGVRTSPTTVYLRALVNGAVTTPADSGTGFIVGIAFQGITTWKSEVYFTAVAGSAITPGTYFSIYSPAATQFAIWFRVNGVGTAPTVPGATLIQVDVLSADTAPQVATKTLLKISGNQVTNILAKAGNAIPAGSYFNINTNARQCYVWFTVDGAGNNPAPAGRTALPVTLLSTDTAAQVQAKITYAISAFLFKVPNRNNGLFARGGPVNPTSTLDPDFADRSSGNMLGSLQPWQIQSHVHTLSPNVWVDAPAPSGVGNINDRLSSVTMQTSATGGNQTNPVNVYTRYIIRF
jgi:hypothetical protein